VCRYNWHSAGSPGWPFPVLKYKYIFQTKYTETVLSNSTRKLLRFEIISKMLIAVKNKLIVLFVIIFGMRSFRIRRLRLWCYAMQPRNHSLVISWRLPSWLTFITCTDRPIDLRVMCADELIIGSICLSLMARSHYAAEVRTLQMERIIAYVHDRKCPTHSQQLPQDFG